MKKYRWANGFETNNAILNVLPYRPEVIFVGSFNHGWQWNDADTFYGRGMYMHTALCNIFLNRKNILTKRRQPNATPTLEQIHQVYHTAKITFADIVLGTAAKVDCQTQKTSNSVVVNNSYIWKGYKDSCLDALGNKGWLDDNVSNIIEYINATPSIRHVYFTFKTGSWLVKKQKQVQLGISIPTCSIFTPSMQGFGKSLATPFQPRAFSLAHCWVWNGLEHPIPINRSGYGHLDHTWLVQNGVNPNNF